MPKLKVKHCDSCGIIFQGESYPMLNENFVPHKGLEQCKKCYSITVAGESIYITDQTGIIPPDAI